MDAAPVFGRVERNAVMLMDISISKWVINCEMDVNLNAIRIHYVG